MSAGAPPLVSVVMAAFNAAAHIAAACQSALQQTYSQLELIVVDDGSTDDTAAIVGQLAATDSRVRLLRQANAGVAHARNTAIRACAGEFLAPLDADDVWDVRKIERQMARMLAGGPDVGLVYCWWVSIAPDGAILDRSPRWVVEGQALQQLIEVNFTGNSSVPLFRRDVVAALGGYDASLHAQGRQGCEDWDLAIRVAERHHVAVVPHVLVAYRRHPDSMSTARETMWQSQLDVTSDLAARHPHLPADVIQQSRGQFALYLAGVSFWAGDLGGAVRWALRTRPLGLLLGVVPHAARLVAARLIGRGRPPQRLSGPRFADDPMPEPLIPYDAVYARRWGPTATAPPGPETSERRS